MHVTVDSDAPDAPLALLEADVREEWIDYNGHMSEAYYVLVCGHATDAFLDRIGMDADHRQRTGCSLYTVEAHVRYLAEVGRGAQLRVTSQLVAMDAKRVRLFHRMLDASTGDLVATEELLLLHVDASVPRTAPFADEIRAQLESIRTAHDVLGLPTGAGRAITL